MNNCWALPRSLIKSRTMVKTAVCLVGMMLIGPDCDRMAWSESAAQTPAAPASARAARRNVGVARSEKLIAGLDGASYEPYASAAVRSIQQALVARGLYDGPTHGILDALTMEAVSEFQKAHHGLHISGIPSPRTRLLLKQGSHTDPAL